MDRFNPKLAAMSIANATLGARLAPRPRKREHGGAFWIALAIAGSGAWAVFLLARTGLFTTGFFS